MSRLDGLVDEEVLEAGDAVIAARIARLVGEPSDSEATLVLAFTVRATREGSTALDPASLDTDLIGEMNLRAVAASALVSQQVMRIDQGLIYLDRYWSDECLVAREIVRRRDTAPPQLDDGPVGLAIAQSDLNDEQRSAVRSVAGRAVTILTGGPGMGKTHTIASVLRAVGGAGGSDDRGGNLRVGLAAPTGKAAARMNESLQGLVGEGPGSPLIAPAVTLHRLLGTRPDNTQRFRHNSHDPLPHDLVVVDEASMVSLGMMARLLESLAPTTRLLLVGDPDQLASVEAGSVLADLVSGLEKSGNVVRLKQDYRMGDDRARIAAAFRTGRAADVLSAIDASTHGVQLVDTDEPSLDCVPHVVEHAWQLRKLAMSGDVGGALKQLGRVRLLCAHRNGPYGVAHWNRLIERELAQRDPEILTRPMYIGRPLLVTRNDYGLGLSNGDTGVVVRTDEGPRAVIETGSLITEFAPWRLADVETMHAMTVHKAQGSQADEVIVILPPVDSPLLSREMLYTAVTRPKQRLVLVGSRESIRVAVESPARRSSGLAKRVSAGGDAKSVSLSPGLGSV